MIDLKLFITDLTYAAYPWMKPEDELQRPIREEWEAGQKALTAPHAVTDTATQQSTK